ncbi:SusD/RagB family nutrient-binding outer membrane lipoprotein [Chitinophaga sp. ARDCPP14]|uniref:SusD/RagB family nutrient-binding outer membrane lipoprotein n=1 Tax=Chitinophaga sp. ARDCPP14 TaxID=3391139 RepID=UPI003F51C780
MRKRYHILAGALLTAATFMAGCKKGWIDINYNPLQLTENNATPDLMLPDMLFNSISGVENQLEAQWMGYWTYAEYATGVTELTYYQLNDGSFGTSSPDPTILLWEANARLHDQPYYIGIAKAIRALQWSRAVDNNNNMPYSEANNTSIRKPKYDTGEFIYEDLMTQLDSAIILIRDAPQDKALRISIADIMFHGEKQKWFRFINTLKLRMLIHQANKPGRENYIKGEIAKITAQGSGFLNSGEDASVNPGFTDVKPSKYYAKYSQYDVYVRYYGLAGNKSIPNWQIASANVTAMNMLKENRDPRLGFFYSPARVPLPANAPEPFAQPGPQEYRGNKFGLPVDEQQFPYNRTEYVSQVGGVRTFRTAVSPLSTGIIKGYDMPCWIITSIESAFLQAEAIQRGWLPGDPETAYKNAVKESFRWLNVGGNTTVPSLSDDAFNTWYNAETAAANPKVSWAAAPDKYKLLMFQKYMAFNGIEPFEAWVDYRRNGAFPDIPLSYDPARIGNTMPIRCPYPLSEMVQNKENLLAQGPIDIFTSKIWWMP